MACVFEIVFGYPLKNVLIDFKATKICDIYPKKIYFFKITNFSNKLVLLEAGKTCDIRFKSQMTKLRKDG
jgi:hypothetical protein